MPVPNEPVALLDVIPEQPDDEVTVDSPGPVGSGDALLPDRACDNTRDQPQIAETVLTDAPVGGHEIIDDPSILQSGIGDLDSTTSDNLKPGNQPVSSTLLFESRDDDVIDKISETNVSRSTSKSQISRQPSWLKPKVDYIPSQQWQLQGGNSTMTSNRTVSSLMTKHKFCFRRRKLLSQTLSLVEGKNTYPYF